VQLLLRKPEQFAPNCFKCTTDFAEYPIFRRIACWPMGAQGSERQASVRGFQSGGPTRCLGPDLLWNRDEPILKRSIGYRTGRGSGDEVSMSPNRLECAFRLLSTEALNVEGGREHGHDSFASPSGPAES
jgi:hypothetical protein